MSAFAQACVTGLLLGFDIVITAYNVVLVVRYFH